MKKSIKRWLALLLAVAMIVTSGAFTNLTYLRATDGEETVEAQVEEPKAETQEKEKEKTEKVTVEQAEPEQPAPEVKEEKKEETAPQEEASQEETKEESSNKEETPSAEVKEEQETVSEEKTEESAPAASEETATVDAQGEKTEETAGEVTAEAPAEETETSEESTAKTEEVKYPAVSFEEKASNGVRVKVEAPEGAFPEGTTIKVKAVSDEKAMSIYEQTLPENQRAVDAKGVDITFYNAEGEEIQPKKEIKVSLKCEALEGENFSVVHEKDNGDAEVMTKDATATGATFGATSFSVYTMGSSETIYEGTQDDATVEEENAVVVAIKVQTEDGTPIKQDSKTVYKEEDEETFSFSYRLDVLDAGYYYSLAEGTDAAFKLEGTTLTASFTEAGTATVTVIQVAQEVDYTIIVREQSLDNQEVLTEVSSTTAKGKVGEMTEIIPDEKEGFSASVDQQVIAASGTVVYVDYTRNTYFLTYNTNGGSYVQSKSGVYGATVDVYSSKVKTCTREEHTHSAEPTESAWRNQGNTIGCYTSEQSGWSWKWVLTCTITEHVHSSACQYAIYNPAPTRQGYTFDGWYADADCTQAADETATLTGNVTVYAKWIPGTADYRVVYQKQNLDGTYSYVSSETKSGTVGTTVSGSNYSKTFTDSSYYHKASSTSAAVKADGSTVVYVKYDLNTYYLVFDLNTNNSNITLTKDGNSYTKDTSPKYTITCKFGEDISTKWPTKDDISGTSSDTSFYGWKRENSNSIYVSKRFEVTADMLNNTSNGSSTSYTASWKSGSSVYLHYMLQNTDDNGYTDSEKYSQAAIRGTGDKDYTAKDIAGYTYITGTPSGYQSTYTDSTTGVKHYYFYYDRKTYDIDYYFGSEKLTTKSNIRFGKNINNDTYNYTPDKPSAVDPEATFGGWYDNPDCTGDPYTFSTMPANNLALYANWVVPDKTVTVVYHNGDKDGSIKVPKGSYIEDLPNPTRDGYEFAGWFDENGEAFDINAPVMQDVTIYAHWTEKTTVSYVVQYVYGGAVVASEMKYGKVGSIVSAKASLPEEYSSSEYIVAPARASLTLTSAESENIITFTIKQLSELKYTVEYKYNGSFVKNADGNDIKDTTVYNASSTTQRVYPNSTVVQQLNSQGYKLDKTYVTLNYTGEETTLVATFTLSPKVYTITYDGMTGATWPEGANHPSTYTTVSEPISISNPVKTGYEFVGWTIDGENTKDVTGNHNGTNMVIGTGSKGNLTFTATWTIKKFSYTVKYYLKDTTTSLKDPVTGEEKDYNSTITVSAEEIQGYHLATGETKDKSLTISTENNVVIFYYEPNLDTKFTVNHYRQNYDGTYPDTADLFETETKTGTTGAKVEDKTYKKIYANYEYVEGAVDETTEAIIAPDGTTVLKLYYKRTAVRQDYDDGIIKVGDNTQDEENEITQGQINVVVYKDGELYNSGIVKYKYYQYAMVDLAITCNENYYLNSIYAMQSTGANSPQPITSSLVDNVKDGTTVYIYVTSKYKVEYTLNGGTEDAPTDTTAYTIPNAGTKPDGYSEYKADLTDKATVTVASLPEDTDDIYWDGWNIKETKVDGGSSFSVKDNSTLADNLTFRFNAVSNGWVPYTVKYYWNGTTESVADAISDKDKAGKTVDGYAKTVAGYTLVDSDVKKSCILDAEGTNEIIFYYYKNVTLTANSDAKNYNGETQTLEGYTGAPEGITFEGVTASGSGKDVQDGGYAVAFSPNAVGKVDATEKYIVTETVAGTLTINPIAITLRSDSSSKKYDKTPLTCESVAVTSGEFISGEGVESYSGFASQTEVGSCNNTFSYQLKANTQEKNYSITQEYGVLTVSKNDNEIIVIISGKTDSVVYDGTPHTVTGYTVESISDSAYTVSDFSCEKTVSITETNAGTYTFGLTEDDFSNTNDRFTNVKFVVTDAKLTIGKRPVTLTSADAEREYNGTALKAETVEASTGEGVGFVGTDGVTYSGFPSITDVDEINNTFTYTAKDGTNLENYQITRVYGKLKVTPINTEVVVTINGNTLTSPYNGDEQSVSGYAFTSTNPLYKESDCTFTGRAQISSKNATTDPISMGLKESDFHNVSKNFTNVKFVVEDGSLEITKVPITLTSDSFTREYDGTELTRPVVTLSGTFVKEEGLKTLKATGAITDVGSTTNTIVYEAKEGTDLKNYDITKNEGTLTITQYAKQVVVTITENGDEKVYNGKSQTVKGYEITAITVDGSSFDLYSKANVSFVGTDADQTVSGTNAGEYPMGLTSAHFKNSNNNFKDVKFEIIDNTLKINKRPITLQSEDDEKVYDSFPLERKVVNYATDSLQFVDTVSYVDFVSQTQVGNRQNTFTVKFEDDSKKENYDIELLYGTLTVTDGNTNQDVSPDKVITKNHNTNKVYQLGDTVEFTITVTNIYDELKDITITEQNGVIITGDSVFTNVEPGATVTTTASYTITQEDILKGDFTNTATASFSGAKSFAGEDTVDEIDDKNAQITINKTAPDKLPGDKLYGLNDTIPYTITVKNTGNLDLTDVVVTDGLAGLIINSMPDGAVQNGAAITIGALAVGQTKTITASYVVTENDILSSSVSNTASVVATSHDPDNSNLSGSSTKEVAVATANPSLNITKTADKSTACYADEIKYTITVTNNGNVTVNNVEVTDALSGLTITEWPEGATVDGNTVKLGTIGIGESKVIKAAYTVTSQDILNSQVTNTATVTGKSSNNVDISQNAVCTIPAEAVSTTLEAEKTSNVGTGKTAALGQTIEYTIKVTNKGNVPVKEVTVTDELTGNTGENVKVIGSLNPGVSKTVTTYYTVTENDILNGIITNEAFAQGTGADGKVTTSNNATCTDYAEQKAPSIEVTKTSDLGQGQKAALGQKITYTITVKNTGNLTVKNIAVTDALTGNTDENCIIGENGIRDLAPNESDSVTVEYTVTEADILVGTITNIAEVTGTASDNQSVTGQAQAVDYTADVSKALTVQKKLNNTAPVELNDELTYTITVTNSGNITVNNIIVTDELTGNIGDNVLNVGTLAPGKTNTVTTRVQKVTENDIQNQKIINTATATGNTEVGTVSASGTCETPTKVKHPSLSVTKTSDVAENQTAELGQTIHYTITVTNNGNVTVKDITVADELTGNTGDNVLNVGTLAPGASAKFNPAYTVKESDILTGIVTNTAIATGTAVGVDDPEKATVSDTATVADNTVAPEAELTVTKTSSVEADTKVNLNDEITYGIHVENTGNVTVNNITVTDALTGNTGNRAFTIDSLAPGKTADFTTEKYVVTEDDIKKGSITNTAVATGTGANNESVGASGSVTDSTVDPAPALKVTKTSNLEGKKAALDQEITYSILIENTGNVTVNGIKVEDAKTGNAGENAISVGTLAPGGSTTVTTTYTVTEQDILNQKIQNTAVAAGTALNRSVSDEDTISDDTEAVNKSLQVTKNSDKQDKPVSLGEEITYTITVENTGNVTIKDIVVEDSLTGNVGENVLTLDDPLKPGESATVETGKYTVTEQDILAGKVVNVAVASGTGSDNEPTDEFSGQAEDPTDVEGPSLFVEKTSSVNGTAKLNEDISYTIKVTNNGNLTITGIMVEDALTGNTGDKVISAGNLKPGESREVTTDAYKVTEADILKGTITNTAVATGIASNSTSITGTGTVTDYTDPKDSTLSVTKISNVDGTASLGDKIIYTITVKNVGNVTISDIVVEDVLTGNVGNDVIEVGILAPGDEKEVYAEYVVTEEDILNGTIANAATASGTDPEGQPTDKEGTTEDTTDPKDNTLSVTKTSDVSGTASLGQEIKYTITVKNEGNVTVSGIKVEDVLTGKVGDKALDIGTLRPNESKSVTTTYIVTEDDILNGSILNVATASGTDPKNNTTTAEGAKEDETDDKDNTITVSKTSNVPADKKVVLGEEIEYTITVKNEGNVTVSGIKVEDVLTGNVGDKALDIGTLGPNESKTIDPPITYTVTEEDILKGSILNVATATGTDPESEPTVGTDEEKTATETPQASLYIEKTADKTSNLNAGDVITYTITWLNNGNVTLDNVQFKDLLTGEEWDNTVFFGLFKTPLKPGAKGSKTITYTVTEADLLNGSITNIVNGTATDPNGNIVDGNAQETVTTETAAATYTVTKEIVAPKPEYNVGDTINYTIKVTNTGNLTLNNLVVTDQMQGTAGTAVISDQAGVTVDGNKATIAVLRPGASITLNAAYTVTREDADGTISNKVTVNSGSKPGTDPEDPKAPGTPEGGDETDPKPIEKTYLLTIRYVDNDGNVVAPDYTVRLLAGETIDAVASPAVDGYTPDYGTVALPATGMPAQDVTVTVVYTANVAVLPVNPGQPNDDNDNGGGQVVNNNDNAPAPVADDAPAPEPQAPADGVIEPTDDGGYDLTPVEEPQTPLGNMDLDDHTCCILHFLIMLLTLILFALYTKSRKNRQMKVAELKEQLAIATIQKELGLSDEEMAKYLEEAKNLANTDKQANA